MADNKILIVRKLDIAQFMDAMQELYHMGINYIDLYGQVKENGDEIYISFCKEYMDKEFQDQFDDILPNANSIPKVNTKLSEDDINQIS